MVLAEASRGAVRCGEESRPSSGLDGDEEKAWLAGFRWLPAAEGQGSWPCLVPKNFAKYK